MNAKVYTLKCLTNMHVGNGEANFNIIDNEVERDPVYNLPVINSSGVKGAFRQYFEQNSTAEKDVEKLFGSPVKEVISDDDEKNNKEKQKKSKPGNLKFLSANLLGMPLRASKGNLAWYMVTTKDALLKYAELLQAIGVTVAENSSLDFFNAVSELENNTCYKSCEDNIGVEDINQLEQINNNALADFLEDLLGRKVVILSAAKMRTVSLPVMARNQLENGQSMNLWYEEVVPHESLFYCIVLSDAPQDALTVFNEKVNGQVVQFGGNASIGYGLCQVSLLAQAGK